MNCRTKSRERVATRIACLALMLAPLLLSGCSSYEKLQQQPIDENYALDGFRWTSGTSTLVVLKAFRSGDRLALCGAYSDTGATEGDTRLTRQYFDRSIVSVGGEEIGNLTFINQISTSAMTVGKKADIYVVTESSALANCVKTEMPWNEKYLLGEITHKGPQRVRDRF